MHHTLTDNYQKNVIEPNHIDTTVSASNFSNLLRSNKTYFLNGAWGSGKTEFLKEVESYSEKKFITLDFWRITDERSVVSIATSKLHPITYWGLKAIMILSVVISILMTNIVNLGLSRFLDSLFIAQVAGVLSLLVAVWSFFKIKSDLFYVKLLKNYSFKNKVLVIDDFDRIDPLTQEQIYTLFNILEGNMPIIFVGDYNKLSQNNGKFLQKIINRKVELPFVLQPQNIWSEYFKELSNKLHCPIPDVLEKIAIHDQRNLREREQFNDYVNTEFFTRKKLNYVQPAHQLLIIYVYLFYPDYYNILLSDSEFEFSEKFKTQEESNSIFKNTDNLHSLLYAMQRNETNGYPYPFMKNRQGYFLYEQPLNQTIQTLNSLIQDDTALAKNLLSDMNTDFYTYIVTNYSNFEKEKINKIFIASLKLVKTYKDSSLIRYIITEKNEEIMPRKQYLGDNAWGIPEERVNKSDLQIHEEIYNSWHNILNKHDFDFSQELYLLEKYTELHFHALGVLFSEIDIFENDFKDARRKDVLLLTYLSSKNLYAKMKEWPEDIWLILEELPDKQYLAFWVSQGLLDNGRFHDFDFTPEDKQYILWENKRNFEYLNKTIDYKFILNRIQQRIEKIEEKGYTFIKKAQK